MTWMCKNGHLVKHQHQADMECAKCRANTRRRKSQKPYNPDTDPAEKKPWPVGLDRGRMGEVTPNAKVSEGENGK